MWVCFHIADNVKMYQNRTPMEKPVKKTESSKLSDLHINKLGFNETTVCKIEQTFIFRNHQTSVYQSNI